ncbi:MAG: hypothetical protein KJ558_07060 [Gammaproteobacteria bacterium]|nr:hypothetical protein [Gammaproteobacteria bacterium]MBU1654575.1 hypothetical protein [Gammaproteobacteria bacterium]
MEFWTGVVGKPGIAWALVMEAVALFLWYRGNRLMAVLASLIVITGPLYVLSYPVLSESIEKGVNAALIIESRAEIASLESSLTQYQGNSGRRSGWADRIDQARRRLDEARGELRDLLQQERGKRQGFQRVIVVSLQVAAVILMMVAQILAVSDLRKWFRPAFRPIETAENPPDSGRGTATNPAPVCDAPPPLPFDRRSLLSKRIAEALTLPDFSGKGTLLAQACGVRPADISLLINHDRRQREGRETASQRVVEKVECYLRDRGGGIR